MASGAQDRQARGGIARATPGLLMRALALVLALLAAPVAAQTTAVMNAATLMADQVFVDAAGRLVATGSVEVWHGSTRLTAARVVFDRRQNILNIDGPITIADGPDQVILADSAQLSPSLRAGIVTSARVVLDQQMQIAAARVQRGVNGVSQMDAVVASSCPVCATNPTPLWEIRAERVIHDENTGRLMFHRAQLRFAGVPVFYAPRLALPAPGNDRLRGVLRPEIDVDSSLGLAVGIPYFIPFGDRSDLTLTPTLTTAGSVTLGFRWRAARLNGGIEVGGQVSRDNLLPGETRGYLYARALYALSNGWRLTADLAVASDRSYLETYGITDGARLSGHLTLERIRRDQAIRARALGFYSMRAADVNEELPNTAVQADLDQRIGLGQTALGGEARVRIGARSFWRASATDGVAGRDVARAYLQLGWRRSAVMAGGVVITGALDARVDHVRVGDDVAYAAPVTRRATQAMVELRWPWAVVGSDGARHVIEPVLQLVSSRRDAVSLPNDDHTMPELDAGNLFALTRYSGADAPDDGNRINAGLRWTRHIDDGWTSEALVGRVWRDAPIDGFDPAHVQPLGGMVSDWLLAGRLSHANGYSMTMRLLLDPANSVTRAETNLAWSGRSTTVSTRYLYLPATAFEDRTTTLSEWSFDLERGLSNGWRSTMGWDYDVGQSLFAIARTGLQFRNECLSFDLTMARQFVTATNSTASTRFNMRVELLGIGGRAPSNGGRTCRA